MNHASTADASSRSALASACRLFGVALVALTLLVGAAVPAAAAELMRVTFVRHGQSAGNASGNIDTSTPGPVLTQLGQEQARAVVDRLGVNNYDAIYASTMVRTQLTAAPTSQHLRLPIQVLPGLQEIEAGVFEGTPESQAQNGYGLFPLAWALQGNRDLRIPGSIDGNEFDARVDGALQTIYDNGDRNAVVFSHGGAIMFWTMMNAANLTTTQKLDLLRYAALGNTNYVVVEGNPEDGWVLVDWNGQRFTPEPTLGNEVQLQLRTLQRQLAATVQRVVEAFATLNPAKVVAAVIQGVGDATFSVAKFAGAVNDKVVRDLQSLAPATAPVQSVQAVTTHAPSSTAPAAAAHPTADSPTPEAMTGEAPKASATAVQEKTGTEAKPAEEPTPAPETDVAPNGATSLKDGNKAEPGDTAQQAGAAGDSEADSASVDVVDASSPAPDSDGGDAGEDSDSE